MTWIGKINRFLGERPKAFVIDEDASDCVKASNIVKSKNVDVDSYSDFKQLLYVLQSTKLHKYQVGVIHRTNHTYSSQVLSNFIKQIDPEIRIVLYEDESELQTLSYH